MEVKKFGQVTRTRRLTANLTEDDVNQAIVDYAAKRGLTPRGNQEGDNGYSFRWDVDIEVKYDCVSGATVLLEETWTSEGEEP